MLRYVERRQRAGRAAGLAALVLAVAVAVGAPAGAVQRGVEDAEALRLEVATNTVTAPGVLVRQGEALVRTYRLRNLAEYPLRSVRIRDAQVSPAAFVCGGGRLGPLGELTCVSMLRAGTSSGMVTVTASALAPAPYAAPQVRARAGFRVRDAGLSLRRTVRRTGGEVRLAYLVSAAGTVPLDDLRLVDPLLANARLLCAGHPGLPPRLAPAGSVGCSALVTAVPGTHRSLGRISAAADDGAVADDGRPLPALALAAVADGGYAYAVPPGPPTTGTPAPGTPAPGTPATGIPGTGGSRSARTAAAKKKRFATRRPADSRTGAAAAAAAAGRTARLPHAAAPSPGGALPRTPKDPRHPPGLLGAPLGPDSEDWALTVELMLLVPALLVAVNSAVPTRGGSSPTERRSRGPGTTGPGEEPGTKNEPR